MCSEVVGTFIIVEMADQASLPKGFLLELSEEYRAAYGPAWEFVISVFGNRVFSLLIFLEASGLEQGTNLRLWNGKIRLAECPG